MDSPDIIPDSQPDSIDSYLTSMAAQVEAHTLADDYADLEDDAVANLQKPNLPNVNVPERIIFCVDVCYDDANSRFKLNDGTSYNPMNMLKRVLDFFIHSKHSINGRTEFALLILKDSEACWVQNFTHSIKDIFHAIDTICGEESTSEVFDFQNVFNILQGTVEIPEYKAGECILPPPYVVRMIVLYGRSNCIPQIPLEDNYFNNLKKQLYFYIDIILAHEDDCALYKCEEIYDALQDLDNGYSYVFEVSRHATKVHDATAKLLAHPLQRPLQKNTNYTFGSARKCN